MKMRLRPLVAAVRERHRTRPRVTDPADVDPLHRPFDEILDIYVRDGLVYYCALKSERGKLDRYVHSLAETRASRCKGWPRNGSRVLDQRLQRLCPQNRDRSLSDSRQSPEYPANSIGQIPGAFERLYAPRRRPYRSARRVSSGT